MSHLKMGSGVLWCVGVESLAVHFRPSVSDAKEMRLNKLGELLDPSDIVMCDSVCNDSLSEDLNDFFNSLQEW